MKSRRRRSITEYLKKNLTRILVLAVIVTSCYSLKFAAYGKYIDYMNDFSSVTVGDFCFNSSDLTDESVESKHNISSFNRTNITLTFTIKNYENSYYFNEEGKDIYFYVQAEVYTDPEFSVKTTNAIITDISYGNGTASEAARVLGLRRDNGTNTTTQGDGIYNAVGCLKAMPGSVYKKENGICPVQVNIRWPGEVTHAQYVRILAKVIPPYESGILEANRYGTFEGPEPSVYAQEEGIFDKLIDAKYILNVGGGGGSTNLVGSITRQSSNDYAITYTIANPGEYPMSAKIYFDPERLTPDTSLGDVYTEEVKDSEGHVIKTLYYVNSLKTIFEKGSEDFSFYKKSLFDTITDYEGGDIYLKMVEQAK